MDRIADDFDKINSAADTMGILLDDLLELSRIGRVMGTPVTCNLAEIANKDWALKWRVPVSDWRW